ncbi:hypothetical protein [Methylovulum psychrotolerans]|jgi:hypothetical protein|uniref:SAM-dependent methyltransferase n=1 Tax=Methylovulum psychrotolerans TaxID=1704499 RepID=A0A1Z4BWI3_9GAMM|nr:hypothetical protein [Methylovulum psychrotolerans]ASF45599.1 hypothetical protein CEK71_05680 [Methylovulum psychrotolerans]
MRVDFKNAAIRHFNDGELLYAHSRWANADQLYGVSSECVLKHIIVGLKPDSVDPITGDFLRNSPHKKHFDNQYAARDLWDHFSVTFNVDLLARSGYGMPDVNYFGDWDIFQRYVHECCIDKQRTDSHRSATRELHNLLQELFIKGVIQ